MNIDKLFQEFNNRSLANFYIYSEMIGIYFLMDRFFLGKLVKSEIMKIIHQQIEAELKKDYLTWDLLKLERCPFSPLQHVSIIYCELGRDKEDSEIVSRWKNGV